MAQSRSQKQESYTPGENSWSYLAILLLIMSIKAHLVTASDTMYPGQSLAWNQTLISESGISEMGTSRHYHLGIWYKIVSEFTVVWEAYGAFSDPILQFSDDGVPSVFPGKLGSFGSNIGIGVLLDNGNFILNSKFDNTVLYQTFGDATNTWLPGTAFKIYPIFFQSGYSSSPLTDGPYSAALLEKDGTGYLSLFYNDNQYGRNLSAKELTNQYVNVSESYFIYSVVSPYKFARFVLNVTGEFILYVWNNDLHQWNSVWKTPPHRCEILGICGDNGICNEQNSPLCDCPKGFRPKAPREWDFLEYTGGCQRSKPLECSDNKLLTMPNMRFVKAAEYPVVKNVEECKLYCLSNCFCVAYSYNNKCLIYRGKLRNLEQLSSDNKLGGDFHVCVSMGSKIKISKKVAWIVGVLIVLILLIGIQYFGVMGKQVQKIQKRGGSPLNWNMAQSRSQKQESYTPGKNSWSYLAILLLILSIKAHLVTASDTMYPGQSLAWNQTLISESGIFEMGTSRHYHLGIWYKIVSEFTVVWEAYGAFSDPILQFSEDGFLFFIAKTFGDATNTWLPGTAYKIYPIFFQSGYSSSPLTDGPYSAALLEKHGTGYLSLFYNDNQYGRNLSAKELTNQYVNVSESYFIYSVVSPYKFARFVLNVTGEFILYVWNNDLHQWNSVWKTPPHRCEILGICGDNGICNEQNSPLCDCPKGFRPKDPREWDFLEYTGGCQRSKPLECSDNKFLTVPNMRFVEAAEYPVVKNVEECKLNCLRNCFCSAYSNNNECLIYKGTLRNLEQLSSDNKSGGDFHVRVSMGSKIKISKKVAWIVGVLIVLILLIGIVFNMAQRRSQNQEICTTSKVSWWSHFAILFLIMSVLKAHLATASDTIFPGQSLAWNQTLTSKSGIFEMGFFRPGKSHHYNFGIWYKLIAEFTVAWEEDLTYLGLEPGSMALELSKDSLLVTKKGARGDYRVLYDSSSSSTIGVGVLLDNGNFMLKSKLDSTVLWQTFEGTTDKWLPGAKLGLGFNTLTKETEIHLLTLTITGSPLN
ncbi:g-type lectin s-receptor-like serine/threonine-protein kinase [Quercus suber]|uniref:non-specific serine/threonine protein kinase n=1 Tax=Quercus suber TaxID=58331 RepID=A0AAW0LQL7_QUESU